MSHEALFAPLEKRFFHTMDYRRTKTIDLSNIGPQPGLNFEASNEKEQDSERPASTDDGGVGDSIASRTRSNRRVFIPKKGALKRRGAIRKKKNQLSPKIQRLREKSRAEAKQQHIIGTTPETFDENEELVESDKTSLSSETDRPFSELRRHAFF
uniref:Uncharacterized protein n=1 Tax=Acrobeloides nanus TaxID=290746 RepID=A0A914DA67_9BILA